MTGVVEITGFVLGGLTLLISAAEHYEDVCRPFKRYVKFASELGLYQQQLGIQKTIFRTECHLLLAMLTGGQTAKEMLREKTHAAWEDEDLHRRFDEQLGESGTACKGIIQLMRERLKEIQKETDSFGNEIQRSMPISSLIAIRYNAQTGSLPIGVADESLKPSSTSVEEWRPSVGKRLKFSISEERLKGSLEALR
ncbi:hypothetical protein G7Y89_g5590 [Cudoniella acicularis]|uniref:Uncharacterized protein n=1 Tax=Cudoniella acicularis TaxID=354080 RepID=A0A8H4W3N2_9HELO|nr:hypothetical protein G7Y89_g5590 [Cudoniella acicularis]